MQSSSPATFESLEGRRLMSVSATLINGNLQIIANGGNHAETITVSGASTTNATATTRVLGGTTSVLLNTALLKSAAGLTITGASTTGRAVSANMVGFPILPTSDFVYSVSPFGPVGGGIRHSGTVTFNGSITVGDFFIGYDASRATNGRSGFYVEDTASKLGILFDLGAPSAVVSKAKSLTIRATPLLVSPEFAQTLLTLNLAKSNLTGATIGSAIVNAVSSNVTATRIVVSADGKSRSFSAAAVRGIEVSLNGSRESLSLNDLQLTRDINITASKGAASVALRHDAADALSASFAGAQSSQLHVSDSFLVDTTVSATSPTAAVALDNDTLSGVIDLTGAGSKLDSLTVVGAPLPDGSFSGFGRVFNDGSNG